MTKPSISRKLDPAVVAFYAPLYLRTVCAQERLAEGDYEPKEINHLDTMTALKSVVFDHLVDHAKGLIVHEVNKLVSKSFVQKTDDVFNVVFYAGLVGFEKGLRKYDPEKTKTSSGLNYLFQWVNSYAKKELNRIEAPSGVSPSRYETLKKVSAVRKRLAGEIGHEPSNEELLEFFHSGKADRRGMKGRKSDSNKPSKANQALTIKTLEEQQQVEKQMFAMSMDPMSSFTDTFFSEDSSHDSESLFVVFLESYEFEDDAVAVLLSEIGKTVNVEHLSDEEYSHYADLWHEMLRDQSSLFYEFVDNVDPSEYMDIDIEKTRKMIQKSETSHPKSFYKDLIKVS